ncbi:hypothetical protein BT96DRAFT_1002623 [Gymnopus androsaceus JB14]|uniref:Homeodomain-like protein n=1 Tax=Gymnopus androsaceus JB14 TaxID=1447944 RepID=A0A6A4GYH1_9AGAR|nr:hypothetical protein BT96DRAFT_1002623 [Gymnopus androsaceus JB14]
MGYRERRPWTPEEDELLRAAVIKEEPGNQSPSKWFAIATHVPGRTNKDCRKRWFARMTGDIVKGSWAAEEDAKLIAAVAKHGTKWSMVATMDQILLDAVNQHGTCWKKIVQTYFPGKTGLSAKNRYTSLSRHQDISQTLRSRPKDDDVKFELASTAFRTSNERFYPSPFSKRAHSNEARLRSNSPHSIYRSPSVENPNGTILRRPAMRAMITRLMLIKLLQSTQWIRTGIGMVDTPHTSK